MRTLLPTLLLAVGLATGCATKPEPSLYERLGGRDKIQAIVVDSFANVGADARIRARFAHVDGAKLSGNLVDLICERTGGPCVYKGVNMADSHEGMHIRDEEFDALVEDLMLSMRKFNVPERERRESVAILERLRNAIVGH